MYLKIRYVQIPFYLYSFVPLSEIIAISHRVFFMFSVHISFRYINIICFCKICSMDILFYIGEDMLEGCSILVYRIYCFLPLMIYKPFLGFLTCLPVKS